MFGALSSMNIYPLLLLVLVPSLAITSNARPSHPQCVPSSCGNIRNISWPFRLKSDPNGCGVPRYELICENNRTVLYFQGSRFYVLSIDYDKWLIKLVDDRLQKNIWCSLLHQSFTVYNFTNLLFPDSLGPFVAAVTTLIIVNCSRPVISPLYISIGPCSEVSSLSNASPNWSLYALVGPTTSDVRDFCTISGGMLVPSPDFGPSDENTMRSYNYERIRNIMSDGFLSYIILPLWPSPKATKEFFSCFFPVVYNGAYEVCGPQPSFGFGSIFDDIAIVTAWDFMAILVDFCVAKFVIGMPIVVIFLIYKHRRRHLAMDKNIEDFLQAHNNFLPIRYSYSNIKKITMNFKHKLGEGGYGSVYKGILRSGNEVAIKILKQSKAHGQDFINEVATIGRIHHVNIVPLVGFCFEGSKQALVYDLMSNGSLDKHIFSTEVNKFLDYRKIYEIALGVARGIEYLHRGCDMQILHFDIKPHNILLDKNFTPKVSDFGLARLYPTNHNTISLTAARGTLGYMAPELFYKNIGSVSYKADVYSFGMLLMEMAGRRKNINANAERSSEIYFPLWVYDHVNEGERDEIEEVVEEERQVIKKMIIVALWCIQLNPDHRPPMRKVLEMLEGDINKLQMPPKPLFYPSDEPVNDDEAEMELETFSASSSAQIISASFPVGDNDPV